MSSFTVYNTADAIPELTVGKISVSEISATDLDANEATIDLLNPRTVLYNGMKTISIVGYTPTSFLGTPAGTAIPLNNAPGLPLATSETDPQLLQLPGLTYETSLGPAPIPYQPVTLLVNTNNTNLVDTGGGPGTVSIGLTTGLNVPPSAGGSNVLLLNQGPISSPATGIWGVEAGSVPEGGQPESPPAPFGPTRLGTSGALIGNPFLPGDPISWVLANNKLFLTLESNVAFSSGELAVMFTFRVPAYGEFVS